MPLPDAAVSVLEYHFEALFPGGICPHPAPKFSDEPPLFFQSRCSLLLVDDALFSRAVALSLYLRRDLDGLHVQGLFQYVQGLHLFGAVSPAYGHAVVVPGFFGDLPCAGEFIVFGPPGFHNAFFVNAVPVPERVAEQMEHEVVDHIGRDPRRAESYIDVVGGSRRRQDFFDGPYVACKTVAMLAACFPRFFQFAHEISGKIFFGSLPSLVRVSIPFERVLKYGASQRAYHRIRCFSGNVGHVFDIHTAQLGKAENEGIGYAARATAAGPVRPGGCTPAAAGRRGGLSLRTAGRIKRLSPVKGQVDTVVVCHNIH